MGAGGAKYDQTNAGPCGFCARRAGAGGSAQRSRAATAKTKALLAAKGAALSAPAAAASAAAANKTKEPSSGPLLRAKVGAPAREPQKPLASIVRSAKVELSADAGTFIPGAAAATLRQLPPASAAEASGEGKKASSIIQTSKYRDLLRSSAPTAKQQPASRAAAAAPRAAEDSSNGLAAVGDLGRLWAKAFQPQPSESQAERDNKESLKKLKQTWSANGKATDARAPKMARDDIQVELLSADKDISDPIVWSEDETSVHVRTKRGHKHPSAHHVYPEHRAVPAGKTRSYVMQDLSKELDHVVAKFIHRLHLFHEQTVDKVPKRYVLGLTECCRRARQLKLKCVVIAPDMDEANDTTTLDDRVRQVLAFAYQNNIEVIFALNRQGLGRAFGKSMGVSIIGVLDTTGANALYDEAVTIARDLRSSWLARRGAAPSLAEPQKEQRRPAQRAGGGRDATSGGGAGRRNG
eukprot:TRINITY_DN37606_c0_g1_i1.p2 TRINITY_DN37606_c0_g1~~TRINITY_DN37606_c0_g1_i1.p2  ORF type:complete len:466 (-),score=144.46 TRINITY_DN37606_c0_g1_i1:83-1480(-)